MEIPIRNANTASWPHTPRKQMDLGLEDTDAISQIQQIKQVTVAPNSTQGVPQPVTNVVVVRSPVGTTQYKITVSFLNPSDPYFQGVLVWLKQGTGNPVQVTSGKQSPLSFVVTKSLSSSAVIVQSTGRWGETPLSQSPTGRLSLQ